MQHLREGLLAVHAAVLIFGFTALFSKLITLPALDITFDSMCTGCLCCCVCRFIFGGVVNFQ